VAAVIAGGLLAMAAAGGLVALLVVRTSHHPSAIRPSPPARTTAPPPGRCLPVPHSCGFPDAANTGVPYGMRLRSVPGQVSSGRGWEFDPRGRVVVTGAGAVLAGLYIPYTVDVEANDVTIKDDHIVAGGRTSFGIAVRHTAGVTIEHDTINGRNGSSGRVMAAVKDIYADSTGLRVLDSNIFDAGVGVQMESGLIQGNFVHDMGYLPGDHLDGINSDGGSSGMLTIRHNTIFCNHVQTDAIGLFEDFGSQQNRLVTGNLLAGGSYTIYAGQNSGGPATSNITITDNRIATLYFPQGGQYGPVTAFNPATTTWTGNVWDSTGAAIPGP